MKNLKRAKVLIIVLALIYLTAALIELDFDLSLWDVKTRLHASYLALCICLVTLYNAVFE